MVVCIAYRIAGNEMRSVEMDSIKRHFEAQRAQIIFGVTLVFSGWLPPLRFHYVLLLAIFDKYKSSWLMNLFQFSILIWKICRNHWTCTIDLYMCICAHKRRYRLHEHRIAYIPLLYTDTMRQGEIWMQYDRFLKTGTGASENCSTLWNRLLWNIPWHYIILSCDSPTALLFDFSFGFDSNKIHAQCMLACVERERKRMPFVHGKWTSLDSGTINETHEYILKDISINSRSESKLYCTRSDADNFQVFVQLLFNGTQWHVFDWGCETLVYDSKVKRTHRDVVCVISNAFN